MTAPRWPEWAWIGRDRGHVWHIIKRLDLTDETSTTFCGKSVLNTRKQGVMNWDGVEKCSECIRLADAAGGAVVTAPAKMTKGEMRRARKQALAEGRPLVGVLALPGDRGDGPQEFTESARGYRARERWARCYDSLNGAPESDGDR